MGQVEISENDSMDLSCSSEVGSHVASSDNMNKKLYAE